MRYKEIQRFIRSTTQANHKYYPELAEFNSHHNLFY